MTSDGDDSDSDGDDSDSDGDDDGGDGDGDDDDSDGGDSGDDSDGLQGYSMSFRVSAIGHMDMTSSPRGAHPIAASGQSTAADTA